MLNSGELRSIHVGKRVLIPRDAVLNLIDMQTAAPVAVETSQLGDLKARTDIVTIRPASTAS